MGNEQYQRLVTEGASLNLSSWPGLHGLLHVPGWSLFTESEDSGQQCFVHLLLQLFNFMRAAVYPTLLTTLHQLWSSCLSFLSLECWPPLHISLPSGN